MADLSSQQRRDQITMMFWGGLVVAILAGGLMLVTRPNGDPHGTGFVSVIAAVVSAIAASVAFLGAVAYATRIGFESVDPASRP